MRAIALYIESLRNNQFWANRCESHNNMNRNVCRLTPGASMAGEPSNLGRNIQGIYFLETNSNSPFGRGVW
jgi:pancreatic triacylglycerol lipase